MVPAIRLLSPAPGIYRAGTPSRHPGVRTMRTHRLEWYAPLALVIALLAPVAARAQDGYASGPIPGVRTGGSRNMKVMSHVPLGARGSTGDIDIEQELSR